MKSIAILLTGTCIAVRLSAAEAPTPSIIPQPAKLIQQAGSFTLNRDAVIFADDASRLAAEQLAARLRQATGFRLEIRAAGGGGKTSKGSLCLTTRDAKAGLGSEAYELIVGDAVTIRAPQAAGVFYGAQTLLQLLPPEVFGTNSVKGARWTIPAVRIEDQPRFAWRGLMLDVSRHFFTKDEVKAYLDVMALHKLNTFHWHLVDDQGWRIEIKKYPRLTEVGAWRSDVGFGFNPKDTTAYGKDGRYGGFYTQDDIREILDYAARRHITIVPEIEMPGHSVAALAAYPQFSCGGSGYSTDIGVGVQHGVYCAGKDETFGFVQDVLAEVITLFPGKFIHIGGDEVPKDNWKQCEKCQARIKAEGLKNEHELQSYFIRRVEKFINAQGRRLIGWSEIREGGLAESAALMDWIGGGAESAASGHDVVMSPTSHCYFDYAQSRSKGEPKAMGGFLPLQTVYSFEPMPGNLTPEVRRHVLGGQGNLWTEYIANFSHLQYMTFPRACALAEVVWSPVEARDWAGFQERLAIHEQRLDKRGVNHRNAALGDGVAGLKVGDWQPARITTKGRTMEWDVTAKITAAGEVSVIFEYTKGAHGLDIAWAALLEDGQEISRDTHDGFTGGRPRQPGYTLTVPAPKAGAHYILRAQVAGDGGTDSHGNVLWNFKPATSK